MNDFEAQIIDCARRWQLRWQKFYGYSRVGDELFAYANMAVLSALGFEFYFYGQSREYFHSIALFH